VLFTIITYILGQVFLTDSANLVADFMRFAMLPGIAIWLTRQKNNRYSVDAEDDLYYRESMQLESQGDTRGPA
jgi:hypothetical protein